MRQRACSECQSSLASWRGRGRPRITCSFECSITRKIRRAGEARRQGAREVRAWWLSLTEGQRLTAIAFARANPPPTGYPGGKQTWSYFNRHAFSCEGVPVSVEAA